MSKHIKPVAITDAAQLERLEWHGLYPFMNRGDSDTALFTADQLRKMVERVRATRMNNLERTQEADTIFNNALNDVLAQLPPAPPARIYEHAGVMGTDRRKENSYTAVDIKRMVEEWAKEWGIPGNVKQSMLDHVEGSTTLTVGHE